MSEQSTIDRRFKEFHLANPEVLVNLERLALRWFDAGNQMLAIKMLWEVLRWEVGLSTTGSDGYRLNNNFTSRYVRLMIERHPEWADRFHMRELRAA